VEIALYSRFGTGAVSVNEEIAAHSVHPKYLLASRRYTAQIFHLRPWKHARRVCEPVVVILETDSMMLLMLKCHKRKPLTFTAAPTKTLFAIPANYFYPFTRERGNCGTNNMKRRMCTVLTYRAAPERYTPITVTRFSSSDFSIKPNVKRNRRVQWRTTV